MKQQPVLGNYRKHDRVQFVPVGESMTHQSFAEECEINNIMKKYQQTGVLQHRKEHGGTYGDFISAPGYHEAMTAIVKAEEMFMALPSQVRARFGNDPAQFLATAQDPEQIELMRELGLAASAKPPEGRETPPAKPKTASRKAKSDSTPSDQVDLEEAIEGAPEGA